jgi:hypothetical protein
MHDKFPNAKPTGCKFLRKPQGVALKEQERDTKETVMLL